MIPKIIHYCWFGGKPKPDLVQRCIASWKKKCPDYEIKEWNETNYDINSSYYMKEAYDAKKWAFVSDYARLDIIFKYGGIYLDTDVELLKNLDFLLDEKCFLGAETTGLINTGIGFGAERNSIAVKKMLDEYEGKHFRISDGVYDQVPCPQRNSKPFEKEGYVFTISNIWKRGFVSVYPPEYFCPIDYDTGNMILTKNTVSVHHFTATWISDDEKRLQKELDDIEKKYGKLSFIFRINRKYKFSKEKEEVKNFWEFFKRKVKAKLYRIRNL